MEAKVFNNRENYIKELATYPEYRKAVEETNKLGYTLHLRVVPTSTGNLIVISCQTPKESRFAPQISFDHESQKFSIDTCSYGSLNGSELCEYTRWIVSVTSVITTTLDKFAAWAFERVDSLPVFDPNEKVQAQETKGDVMLKKFYDLKEKFPEAILLLRCGSFYETYSDDAKDAAKVLGITLTKSINRLDKDSTYLAMAGFPYHALDAYIPKLIRAGHRVVICDQL